MAKTKQKVAYVCDCGADFPKWQGQCSVCKEWNLIKEIKLGTASGTPARSGTWVGDNASKILKSHEIKSTGDVERFDTGIGEFNRVLGKGLTLGSVNIISGDPGVGKSTLLIQAMTNLASSTKEKCLYVSGEESLMQVRSRAKRLGLDDEKLLYLSETNVDTIINLSQESKITIMVIDSIQTIYTENCKSAPGSNTQVKESSAILTQYAKKNNISILLVGHVTKDGTMAGPKILEHMVDGYFHIEGDSGSRYRMIRSNKNRFGEANETGVFAMTEEGMKEVKNPSAIFISSTSDEEVSGSSIFVSQEGNRPLLFEVQSLVTESFSEIPRRLSIGVNFQRVSMLLAIMQKHNNFRFHDKDVYVNVVGGVTIPTNETACDLGVCFSIYSSSEDIVIPKSVAAFGEISLSGEVRPVTNGIERIKEADKQGFKYIIVPVANVNKKLLKGVKIKVIPVKTISEATMELNKLKNN